MKSLIFLTLAASAAAQITQGSDGTFVCPQGATAFCAGDSLSSNIIIRCDGTKGQPGNCNDNLAGVPPVGVKSDALCYQTSNTSGDAACSFNGTAYLENGSTMQLPIASSSEGSNAGGSYVASSTSAAAAPPSYQSTTMATQASAAPVNQITDGQVQAQPSTTEAAAPVNQISDGQVQAQPSTSSDEAAAPAETSAASGAVNQIGDGQVQNQASPVNQIGDGQVQNQANTSSTSAPEAAVGGAGHLAASAFMAASFAFIVAIAL